MQEAAVRKTRTAERYLLHPPLSARFGGELVSVCDISAKGARFTHGTELAMGDKSVLRLSLEGRPVPVQIESVVVWTQRDPIVPGRFVSGARTYAAADVVDSMLRHLQAGGRTTRIEELRTSERFRVSQPVEAEFAGERATIENLSARGACVVLPSDVAIGTRGKLTFSVPRFAMAVEATAEVVWTSLKSIDPTAHRAGLSLADRFELMRLAVGQLCESGYAALDTQSLALKLKILRARARVPAVHDDPYHLIRCVREELRLNPEEAMHWYRRARLVINDPATRRAAPAIADHPDALAVWEYLDRSVDPSLIGRAFDLG